ALVGAVIQNDAPLGQNALWVTLPLDPSAVAAAKLLLCGAAVPAVAIAGTLTAIHAYGPGAAALRQAVVARGGAALGLVVIPVVVATVSGSLASYVAAMLVSMVVGMLASVVGLTREAPIPAMPASVVLGIIVVSGVAWKRWRVG